MHCGRELKEINETKINNCKESIKTIRRQKNIQPQLR